ncbi:craniofacial development protein 2-like [Coccinella septempunctata]|uniref:craniofacial development protein 2-like n=1 Tax=Coccinella septempunctata TaxID=41139 RepID=UPI001D07D5F7|nr:craniofacial development protein 2-like [Coccinella septempunctata]
MGFFEFITSNYGHEITTSLKKWSKLNIKLGTSRNRLTPPAALEGGLSSSTVLLPVPSPEKGGGTDNLMTNPARKRRWNGYRKRNIMRMATWNVKTLNNRDQEVVKELEDKNIDICALQETKKKGKGQMWLGEYLLIYSGVERDRRAKEGVALMIHKKLTQNIRECKYVSSRIVATKLRSQGKKVNIIGVYSPENCKPEAERTSFYETLQETIDTIPRNETVILMGDFNARVGNTMIPGVKQRFNEDVTNENGELLIDFCAQNELRINNTFFKHKEQHKYTFQNTRGDRSMIDYILTNRKIHCIQILDIRCLCSANIGSDHNLVLGKIRMAIQKPQNTDPIISETKIKVESLQDESTRNLYKSRLENEIDKNPVTEEEDIEDSWRKIKNNIIKAAREALGERKVNGTSRRVKNTPWFCEEVKLKCQEKTKAYLKYRSRKTREAYEEYKTIRNETNALVRKKKTEHWEKFSKEMEHDFYGLQKEI